MENNMNFFLEILDSNDEDFKKFFNTIGEKFLENNELSSYEAEQIIGNSSPNSYIAIDSLESIVTFIEGKIKNSCEEKQRFFREAIIIPVKKGIEEIKTGKNIFELPIHVEKVDSEAKLPTYAHFSDACADIYSNETITINPGERKIVKTGIKVAVPYGYEMQIRMRSGMSYKTPLILANGIGTIDAGYRDEVGVIFANVGNEPYTVNKYDRIAQMKLSPIVKASWITVKSVEKIGANRNGGFGSTGKK